MESRNVIMISAMYENGGNTTHRMFDGHPELFVYPFESQVGNSHVSDYLSSTVPLRYRWPEFPLTGNNLSDYESFWDEEMKTLLRVPSRSKFRDCGMDLDENLRKQAYIEFASSRPRTRANLIEAYFYSTFVAWKNVQRTGKEKAYLGYNPVQCLDSEKILFDFPQGHVLHVVRNPYSGYSDTKKRPFPISLERYVWTWNLCQHTALVMQGRHPERFHIMRFEDMVADTKGTIDGLCKKMGLSPSETNGYPSFNGKRLTEVFPWGTIRIPTPEANVATKNELSAQEQKEIKSLALPMMRILGYENF